MSSNKIVKRAYPRCNQSGCPSLVMCNSLLKKTSFFANDDVINIADMYKVMSAISNQIANTTDCPYKGKSAANDNKPLHTDPVDNYFVIDEDESKEEFCVTIGLSSENTGIKTFFSVEDIIEIAMEINRDAGCKVIVINCSKEPVFCLPGK